LDLSINKVEDTASGAVACELFDIIYPGSVNMSKVNWAASQSFEYVANYKILQTAFQKNAVDKYIDVDRLITGRYMDNLEFMQWFKRYFELQNASKDDYDTIGQRAKGKGTVDCMHLIMLY
jgi:microtubule-associated protein, RP/EB family